MSGFQCQFSKQGNLVIADGVVMQPSTGVILLVGGGSSFSELGPDLSADEWRRVKPAQSGTFVGGSGRNVISSGLTALASGVQVPVGFFLPTLAGSYRAGIFTLEVTGPDDATISDGTDIVAVLTTGGTAPVGDYDSTAYGETTYHGGTPFVLTVVGEEGAGGDIPSVLVHVTGTAQGGVYAPVSADVYESEEDPDWTLVLDPSGAADLRFLTDVIATRAAGDGWDPAGEFPATVLGKTYNLTDDEPVDGEDWTALVEVIGRVPRVGYGYIEVVKDTGVLVEVNGPFFATALPVPFDETVYVALCYCDGFGLEQYHEGALVLP